jgi:hypothetical protein
MARLALDYLRDLRPVAWAFPHSGIKHNSHYRTLRDGHDWSFGDSKDIS